MNKLELVIFDCDGVLIDSEVISARMLKEELAERDISISIEYIIDNYVGRPYFVVLKDVQKTFSVKLEEDFEDTYRKRLLAAFDRELKIMPNITQVLENLTKLNVPFCVATSSSAKRVQHSLKLVGLNDFFGKNVFTSSLVERGKPAPDLFLYAAETMKANPENTLVIEDSLIGVEAGLAAGMTVWRFVGGSHLLNHKTRNKTAGARQVFNNFQDFFKLSGDLMPKKARLARVIHD